ncbi:DUF3054 domain-containing protein [Subtercola sp. PAMC28395]|uniref:DUF3054 domain-containing protein n=1 Tax=Subtercola sp. PAMC28395 TaxID=2846775 RepID=UPI001C0CF674|nr:DUF3054 domain-containing protein [Subtercola sp. PAMC28395]QWT22999.1 DUF3054 domain-containing protein [Subtercola sp. PAMC28395]
MSESTPAHTSPKSTAPDAAPTGARSPRRAAAPRTILVAAALDVVLLLVFVLIGRNSHDEGFNVLGALNTWWPFLLGLAVGWAATRAWRYPFEVVLPGIPIWLFTVAVGMLFRTLTGQGVAVSFVIVTLIVTGVFLLGWRLLARVIVKRRARSAR